MSVVLCDLDHFKAVNDTHGHEVGDQVPRQFVANANRVLRKSDCVGRWGGEEFMLVLPDTALQHAVAVAERCARHRWSCRVSHRLPSVRVWPLQGTPAAATT